MAFMAALYPRASSGLRAGYDKGAILSSTCKLFALDAPYVELNRLIAGCIVVELDSVLRVEEFRIRLLEILGPRRMSLLMAELTARSVAQRIELRGSVLRRALAEQSLSDYRHKPSATAH